MASFPFLLSVTSSTTILKIVSIFWLSLIYLTGFVHIFPGCIDTASSSNVVSSTRAVAAPFPVFPSGSPRSHSERL